MKVSTTLKNIDYTLKGREHARLFEKEKKELEKDYQKALFNTMYATLYNIIISEERKTSSEAKLLIIENKQQILEKVADSIYNTTEEVEDTEKSLLSGKSETIKRNKYQKNYIDVITDLDLIFFKCLSLASKQADELEKLKKQIEKEKRQDLAPVIYDYLEELIQKKKELYNVADILNTFNRSEFMDSIASDLNTSNGMEFIKEYKKALGAIKTKYKHEPEEEPEQERLSFAWRALGLIEVIKRL